MKKLKYIIKKLILWVPFGIIALLPLHLPIDMENRIRLTNIILLLGGAIVMELENKIFARKGLWSLLKSTRDKIVVATCLFILALTGALFNFPLGMTKISIIAEFLAGILCYGIYKTVGSDHLKTLISGRPNVEKNTDDDENK